MARPCAAWSLPAPAGGRLAHRGVAVLALGLVLLMLMASQSPTPLPRERRLSVALLLLALALAGLGIATPGARVPAVALGNLLGGFAMLALCARLAVAAPRPGAARDQWGLAGLLLLLAQVASGALVSASYSAPACPELLACQRAALSAGWDWQAINLWRDPVPGSPDMPGRLAILVSALHQALTPLTVLLLAALGWGLAPRGAHRWRGLAAADCRELALGPALVAAGLPITLVLAHNLLAALQLALLARLVWIWT